MEDISLFIGRFHPLIVHLPIGILIFAALLEAVAFFQKNAYLRRAVDVALLVGALCAGVAAFAGWLLSSAGGYDANTLSWHQWLGISVAVLALVIWGIRRSQRVDVSVLRVSVSQWLLAGMLLLLSATGHLGGNLTHGSTYLTEYMPKPLKDILAPGDTAVETRVLPASLDSVELFAQLIQPILEEKCIQCHNEDKTKGQLMMTSAAHLEEGGKSGETVLFGQPNESEMFRRITLPRTSQKFMPPDNLPPMTAVEVELVKWWIENAPDYQAKLADTEAEPNHRFLLATYLGMDASENREAVLPTVTEADEAALDALHDMKIIAKPIAQTTNLLTVSFINVRNSEPEQRRKCLEALLKVKDQIYWLDVSDAGLEDDDLKIIAQMPELRQLRVEKNAITDAGVIHLKDLKNLEYLNLYQNPVTNESLLALAQLPALEKLYVWQTKITEKAISELSSSKPTLMVNG